MKKIFYRNKIYKGVWFYGLSGAGKTFASKVINNQTNNSLIIDGDDVRKYISTDLDRTVASRKIQLKRLLGIAIISIKSNLMPIVSGVYMDKLTKTKIEKNNILLIKIERDFKYMKNHKTYKNNSNVVGIDISYPKLSSEVFFNDSTENFIKKINNLVK